jgi:hypothetical protein
MYFLEKGECHPGELSAGFVTQHPSHAVSPIGSVEHHAEKGSDFTGSELTFNNVRDLAKVQGTLDHAGQDRAWAETIIVLERCHDRLAAQIETGSKVIEEVPPTANPQQVAMTIARQGDRSGARNDDYSGRAPGRRF